MKLKRYLEDWDVDVIHAIFHAQEPYATWHWHFQLVDTLYVYIPKGTTKRPRIQWACFEEFTEYELEQEALGFDVRQAAPHGPMDPCFRELAGGWQVKDQLPDLWDELMRNAIESVNGEVAMAVTYCLA
jgi:hypothetical protein